MKGYLKIISIRQGSEPYLNMVVRKVRSDDIDDDDDDGGGGDDGNDDDDDDDKKFPTHTY
jgi:hypothetical protein